MNFSDQLGINCGTEFPPLGAETTNLTDSRLQRSIKQNHTHINNCSPQQPIIYVNGTTNNNYDDLMDGTSLEGAGRKKKKILKAKKAAKLQEQFNSGSPSSQTDSCLSHCIGSRLVDYRIDLENVFRERYINEMSDFILAPIAPIRPTLYEINKFQVIPDIVLSESDWNRRIAVDLGRPNLDSSDPASSKQFDKLFRHALYLGPSAIVITCPDSDIAQATCASITNDRLRNTTIGPQILFRVQMGSQRYHSIPDTWSFNTNLTISNSDNHDEKNPNGTNHQNNNNNIDNGTNQNDHSEFDSELTPTISDYDEHSEIEVDFEESQQQQQQKQDVEPKENYSPWHLWNSIRSHLVPDRKIGVCLSIRDDLSCSQEELNRWTGEPIRMIIISVDQFVRSANMDSKLQLTNKCRKFIEKIVVANSLKTGLVIESCSDQDLAEHMQYLREFINDIESDHPDPLRDWNDKIQPPLQPLSSNLDAGVYACFESDSKKYLKYRDSMIEALDRLLSQDVVQDQDQDHYQNREEERKTFVLMVLGAGRGPLVDNFIDAIRTVNSKHRFKLYALDKNPSSIRSLRYKQRYVWIDQSGNDMFETEVVESDMREWQPAIGLKADIIATELLGSLSDNELSPECIDGVWTISTPKTISIPQQYSSYLAPICGYKLFQELNWIRDVDYTAFDQIYVSKLNNYYLIDEPKQLFSFEHKNLSLRPQQRCNQRFKRLTFRSKTNTICHGFAGYFSSHLFGTTHLSTVAGQSTENMNSWFPAFIPLEQPIELVENSTIEILFWRKESPARVWYEWAIVKPIRSRIHGLNTSMSKLIE